MSSFTWLWIFLSMSSTIFLTLPIHFSPASLGVSILLCVLLLAFSFTLFNVSWLSLILILVYLSGILIIFSYFLSLTQNSSIFLIPLTISFSSAFLFSLFFFFEEKSKIFSNLVSEFSLLNSFLWVLSELPSMLFLIILLLFTLFLIVKILIFKQKPLRLV